MLKSILSQKIPDAEIFMPMTDSSKLFDKISCIQYSVHFLSEFIIALIDSSSIVNAMTLGFAPKLELVFESTNIGVQKIDNTLFSTYAMSTTGFLL